MEIREKVIALCRRRQFAWLLRRQRRSARKHDRQQRKPANISAHRCTSFSNGILADQLCRSIVTDFTTTSLFGLSWRLRGTLTILSATSWPSTTSPKIVCLPVSHVVGASVMKNCEPLVLGPAFAIASLPGLSNLCGEPFVSSSNW